MTPEKGSKPARSAPGSAADRPKNLTFMVGWLVFLGIYQIFLAWKFGTFFEGVHGDLRHYFGGAVLEPLYAQHVPVLSTASAFRYEDDVPVLVPGVNPDHLPLIREQQKRRGWRLSLASVP